MFQTTSRRIVARSFPPHLPLDTRHTVYIVYDANRLVNSVFPRSPYNAVILASAVLAINNNPFPHCARAYNGGKMEPIKLYDLEALKAIESGIRICIKRTFSFVLERYSRERPSSLTLSSHFAINNNRWSKSLFSISVRRSRRTYLLK